MLLGDEQLTHIFSRRPPCRMSRSSLLPTGEDNWGQFVEDTVEAQAGAEAGAGSQAGAAASVGPVAAAAATGAAGLPSEAPAAGLPSEAPAAAAAETPAEAPTAAEPPKSSGKAAVGPPKSSGKAAADAPKSKEAEPDDAFRFRPDSLENESEDEEEETQGVVDEASAAVFEDMASLISSVKDDTYLQHRFAKEGENGVTVKQYVKVMASTYSKLTEKQFMDAIAFWQDESAPWLHVAHDELVQFRRRSEASKRAADARRRRLADEDGASDASGSSPKATGGKAKGKAAGGKANGKAKASLKDSQRKRIRLSGSSSPNVIPSSPPPERAAARVANARIEQMNGYGPEELAEPEPEAAAAAEVVDVRTALRLVSEAQAAVAQVLPVLAKVMTALTVINK